MYIHTTHMNTYVHIHIYLYAHIHTWHVCVHREMYSTYACVGMNVHG